MGEADLELEGARVELGLSHDDLWIRYFALGGMRKELDVEAYVSGVLIPSPHERHVIATALNERFAELGRDQPIGYEHSGDG